MDVSGDTGMFSGEIDLLEDFSGRPGLHFGAVVAGPEVTAFGILFVPPLEEHGITLSGGIDSPIELRGAVVQPAFAQPEAGVGVEGAVGVEALNLLGVSGAPDAERADAEFHVGFDFVNLGVQAFDEIVDVHPAPVFAVHVSLKCFPESL